MDNTTKILIVACIVLVGALGITVGFILTNFFSNGDNNNINTTQLSQNNSTNSTVGVSKQNVTKVNAESKYINKICRRCGKTFKVPRNGEQSYYCDACLNSPELRKQWEEETT